jgi:colanic acid biosynthesis glycosyl transferase WcaI
MKVLFVLNSGFDTPGASNHLLESIIERVLKEGNKVHIIQKHKTGQNPSIPSSLSVYKDLTYDIHKVDNVEKSNFKKRYIDDIKYAFSCLKYYRRSNDVDVTFLQSCNTAFFQILLLKLTVKKPIIYNVQDIFPINALKIGMLKENGLVYKILKLLQKKAYKMADKVITISEDMKKTICKEKVDEDKVDVIYNWSYSDELIEISDENNKFMLNNQINSNHYKVVYAGNIGTLQNVDVIIEAAKILKDEKEIHFYIIGNGVYRDKLLKFVSNNNLNNVTFFPMQETMYAPHIYSMADVNIIPLSKGVIHTALPSKTATCLASGKPIIACIDIESQFSKMIGACDKCSVIDSDDAKNLAICIKEYYNKNIKGYSIGERDLFKRYFSKNKNVDRYVDTIKQLVKS